MNIFNILNFIGNKIQKYELTRYEDDSYTVPFFIGKSYDKNMKKHGVNNVYFFTKKEQIRKSETYSHGVLDGPFIHFHANGKINVQGQYLNRLLNGTKEVYD